MSTTAPLGTNVTFTCHGDYLIFWQINGTQTLSITSELVSLFAQEQIYVPVRKHGFSMLIITATANNNFTHEIECLVAKSGIDQPVVSEVVHLLVYGECIVSYLQLVSLNVANSSCAIMLMPNHVINVPFRWT